LNPVVTPTAAAASSWDEVALHYRQVCLQRFCGDASEHPPASDALAAALERASAVTPDAEEFARRRHEIFATEDARVQQAAITAELVAIFLTRGPFVIRAPSDGLLPAKPPPRPRAVLPPTEDDAIAGLIDGMLAQHGRSGGR
jgi:hypothetical protein